MSHVLHQSHSVDLVVSFANVLLQERNNFLPNSFRAEVFNNSSFHRRKVSVVVSSLKLEPVLEIHSTSPCRNPHLHNADDTSRCDFPKHLDKGLCLLDIPWRVYDESLLAVTSHMFKIRTLDVIQNCFIGSVRPSLCLSSKSISAEVAGLIMTGSKIAHHHLTEPIPLTTTRCSQQENNLRYHFLCLLSFLYPSYSLHPRLASYVSWLFFMSIFAKDRLPHFLKKVEVCILQHLIIFFKK